MSEEYTFEEPETKRRYVIDGDRIQHRMSFKHGLAFAENKKQQWLVRWDDGSLDIIHEDFLSREF